MGLGKVRDEACSNAAILRDHRTVGSCSQAKWQLCCASNAQIRRLQSAAIRVLRRRAAIVYGEPPFYAQVKRDAAQINLRCVDRPIIDPAVRDREELPSAVMTVALTDEIKRLFLELQGKNVAFFQPLKTQAWGARLHYQRPGRKPASVRGPRQVARGRQLAIVRLGASTSDLG
jgi:hypothetical protein